MRLLISQFLMSLARTLNKCVIIPSSRILKELGKSKTGTMSQKHLRFGDPLPALTEGVLHLFSMRFCPYAERTRLVLSIKGLSFEEVNCNLKEKPEFLLERHPDGKVPVVEINGKVIIESVVINDLLNDVYPDPPLYPKDPYAKAEDKIVMETYSSKVIPSFYKYARSGCQDKEGMQKLLAGLELFGAELKKRGTPFLGGDPLPPLTEGGLHLFSMRFCPYAERTRLVFSIKGLSFEEVNCNLLEKPEFLLERHPDETVPVLEINGKVFIDSVVIGDLLNEVYPDPPLYPKDPYAKAEDKIIMERHSSKAIPGFYKYAKSGGEDKEVLETIIASLETFAAELKKRGTPFMGGEQPGMVDLNTWPFNYRLVIFDEPSKFVKEKLPELDAYFRRMEAHPAVKPTMNSKGVTEEFVKSYKTGKIKFDNYD